MAGQIPQVVCGARESPAHTSTHRGKIKKIKKNLEDTFLRITYLPLMCCGLTDNFGYQQVFLSLVQGTSLIQRLINVAYTYDNLAHR